MISAHESGSNPPGAGTLLRDLTKTKSQNFTWALHMESQYPRYSPALGGTWLQMTGALYLYYVPINITLSRFTGTALYNTHDFFIVNV